MYTVQYSWNGPIFPRQVNITKAQYNRFLVEAYGFRGANLKIGVIPISVQVYTGTPSVHSTYVYVVIVWGWSSGEQNNAESDNIIWNNNLCLQIFRKTLVDIIFLVQKHYV